MVKCTLMLKDETLVRIVIKVKLCRLILDTAKQLNDANRRYDHEKNNDKKELKRMIEK
ncbi:hypothetical protein Pmar_PMAR015319 [Perkinsus marinus ATCC 50983]|uniref:Uncharacterized protein n=1 Tax=Perkinsus marinus (strain ATCC 50983 / TXsc) TaxID=423536 RepID=C5KLA1_PERM5|nr:hypothetical protein Pmar_PMAR015319 [Perkinsus marinus ATCC 50983]EER14774.1 hypothetical protein Pmar_PMAR015319 [Perkinsus marinus ATCC 50983]|eukprot:XP_002782978.1 hypothetical protein Pmar_PMAR015319 [Perkinsus marinus ATCC 50983]